jgi:hypothetical protein
MALKKKLSHRGADLGDQYHEIGITAVAVTAPGTSLQHRLLERGVGAEYE